MNNTKKTGTQMGAYLADVLIGFIHVLFLRFLILVITVIKYTWWLFVILGLMALLNGCGKGVQVDPAFQPYLTQFESDAAAQGRLLDVTNLTIQFGTVSEEGMFGDCNLNELGQSTITISKTDWETTEEVYRQELIYHELSHCILRRGHDTAVGSDGCPVSLMNPTQPSADCLTNNHDSYIKELFN